MVSSSYSFRNFHKLLNEKSSKLLQGGLVKYVLTIIYTIQ